MYQVKDGCPGCGACQDICPVNAIVLSTGLAMKITDTCIDCGVCAPVCPVNLIEKVAPLPVAAVPVPVIEDEQEEEVPVKSSRKEVSK